MERRFRAVLPADLPRIVELLTTSALPLAGVEAQIATFR
jgi:hypothetical protein